MTATSGHLVLSVRLHGDGQGTARFHGVAQGEPEWPPSPARLFQALVAGAARDGALSSRIVQALEWLERLPPPVIAAPPRTVGQRVQLFVPNNDADAVSDPRDVSGIRTKKIVEPSLFSADEPLLYAWPLPSDTAPAEVIVALSAELYQLGRGVDMAWAAGELLDDASFADRMAAYRGVIHRPALDGSQHTLACPVPGSLASLIDRHQAVRLSTEGTGKTAHTLFRNAPKPRFLGVSYARARTQILYELRDREADKAWPWRLRDVVRLVETLRDAAAARLREGLPDRAAAVASMIVGRKANSADAGPIDHRVRVVPLPSIGFEHADRAIRRFLLDVPSGAPLHASDVEWAFAGIDAASGTPVPSSLVVVRSDDTDMLRHYRGPSRRWRSITAVALPERAQRRRIEPSRQREEAKDAGERRSEEDRAVAAVHVALRHAGVDGIATSVRVQREPFEGRGARAEQFAEGTRFAKERLWHVELELDRQVFGPLAIGDGRFLGLGVMAPVATTVQASTGGVFALVVEGDVVDDAPGLALALRRAVMARVQSELGARPLGRFFSGHEPDGAKANAPTSNHLAFQWDRVHRRLLVIAPHLLDRRPPTSTEVHDLRTLARALDGFTELRAGRAGRFSVCLTSVDAGDPLLTSARRWTMITPYAITRHPKRTTASDALSADATAQCIALGLPGPSVTVLSARGVPGHGLEGELQLDFAVAVAGPLVLGRTRYAGGGLCMASPAG